MLIKTPVQERLEVTEWEIILPVSLVCSFHLLVLDQVLPICPFRPS